MKRTAKDVVDEKKDWTLDQLIDWVRSVEPTEAAEEAIRQHQERATVSRGHWQPS